MKKFLLFFIFLVSSSSAHSTVAISDILCFTSGGNKPIRFEMRTYFDSDSKWFGGYVKYANSKSLIPIVLSSNEDEITSERAPYQTTQTWLEISNGKISGTYEMMSQGAMVYSMTYTSRSKNKKYDFSFVSDISTDPANGCKWGE